MIQVRINEEGALRNQRHAFSNRFTLVTELLQNARRAGACLIRIEHDPPSKVLTVQDDGHGLDDFQKLLSFHESGWDADTCTREHPFGIGFSKCLYAATRCIVSSGRHRVDMDTEAALARVAVEVEECFDGNAVAGTLVELHGVDLPDLAQRIEELCTGFPVPVSFNGTLLQRAMAEPHLATQASEIGAVHLAGTRDGRHAYETWVFLQGFCVLRPAWSPRERVNVVHLDPRRFMARLPDRDRLIDEDVQRRRIDAELKACWRRTLEIAKSQLPPRDFIDTYYGVMRAWGHLDLLNDLATLPAHLFSLVSGYPVQAEHGQDSHLSPVPTAPSREAIESGAVQLVALDDVGNDNPPRWMMVRARGWLVFDWFGVHADHWVMRHVRFLESEGQRVTPVGEKLRTALEGRWVWPNVVLCEKVRLQVGDDEALVTDAGVCHDGSIYIPDGETTGAPVEQLSSFTDEHEHYLDADCDADREALTDLLRLLRAVDPVQTLDSLLRSLRLGKYPLLHGKTFQLTVGVGPAPGHSIDLVNDVNRESNARRTNDPDVERGAHAGC